MRRLGLLLVAGAVLAGCVTRTRYDEEVRLTETYKQLNDRLQSEVQAKELEIKQLKGRVRLTLADRILFPEGGWEVTSTGRAVLDKIAPALQSAKDNRIEVEGHTDNVPIGNRLRARFPSNWELSGARASDVVRYLQKKGIDPARMMACGFGEYQPTASNATIDGRQANRRTDIDLVPNDGP
ncbi:MAG: OmpA family protein [Gammaproteobacteria bacterium]|nr:OmpA family protein [Gammaproteobacteria bacterium]